MSGSMQMGSPAKYTWREIDRVAPRQRPVPSRLRDFESTEGFYDEDTASAQASRCIQCPNPSCVEACPLAVPVPNLMALVAERKFVEAAELMLSAHRLPEIFTQVCSGQHHCEAGCILGSKSDPLPIGSISRFILNFAAKNGITEPLPQVPTGQKVAVVGSGMCGLVATEVLSRLGHQVAVFDSHSIPGGRIVNGLPGFRVDRQAIEHRVQLLQHRGVRFHLGKTFGRDLVLEDLRSEYDAVFIGLGRAEAVPLEIAGSAVSGVHQAYPFVLRNITNTSAERSKASLAGKRVAVLGGGETAMDTLRVAIRCGAAQAICFCRRDQANMAANPESYRNATDEGALFLFQSLPIEICSNERGTVRAVRCVHTEPAGKDYSGRVAFDGIEGTDFEVSVDVVLVAYGFTPPILPQVGEFGKLELTPNGLIAVDRDMMTNLDGVFAGGSIIRGAAPLSEVVLDARKATEAIHRYLVARRNT